MATKGRERRNSALVREVERELLLNDGIEDDEPGVLLRGEIEPLPVEPLPIKREEGAVN